MAKYELTEKQAMNLIAVLDNTSFKGAEAEIVIGLKRALSAPVEEKAGNKEE